MYVQININTQHNNTKINKKVYVSAYDREELNNTKSCKEYYISF